MVPWPANRESCWSQSCRAWHVQLGIHDSGDVSAIFASKYIAKSTLVSPIDTGLYEMGCTSCSKSQGQGRMAACEPKAGAYHLSDRNDSMRP